MSDWAKLPASLRREAIQNASQPWESDVVQTDLDPAEFSSDIYSALALAKSRAQASTWPTIKARLEAIRAAVSVVYAQNASSWQASTASEPVTGSTYMMHASRYSNNDNELWARFSSVGAIEANLARVTPVVSFQEAGGPWCLLFDVSTGPSKSANVPAAVNLVYDPSSMVVESIAVARPHNTLAYASFFERRFQRVCSQYFVAEAAGVFEYLRGQPEVLGVLEAAPPRIQEVFGDASLRLELLIEPEEDWQRLYLVIRSKLSSAEIVDRESTLLEGWFQSVWHLIQGKLTISAESA